MNFSETLKDQADGDCTHLTEKQLLEKYTSKEVPEVDLHESFAELMQKTIVYILALSVRNCFPSRSITIS
ncbi:hypothetical protein KCU93_g256, partial [Aureobasidium melanogenum]